MNVGDYFVRLESGNSNYTFTPVDVTFTIDPKNLNNVDLWTNISEEGRMTLPRKGIVIVNGKKMFVK